MRSLGISNKNISSANVRFLYPLKTSENQRFSDFFRRYIELEYRLKMDKTRDIKTQQVKHLRNMFLFLIWTGIFSTGFFKYV